MATIYSQRKDYCGMSASVPFVNGVGYTSDPDLIEWFKTHGYTVVEEVANVDGVEDVSEVVEEETPKTEAKKTTRRRTTKKVDE